MPRIINKKNAVSFVFLLFFISGCTGHKSKESFRVEEVSLPGVWHRIESGQTLWRISKAYDIELEELVEINRISDARKINVGQLIFIPYVDAPKKIGAYHNPDESEYFIWPVEGATTSNFNTNHDGYVNKGIDIKAKDSDKLLVLASRSGVITFCDDLNGYAKTVIIDHGDGFSTVYAGNKELDTFIHDYVNQGTQIASLDSDNNNVLHFEIRKNNYPINPYYFLPR